MAKANILYLGSNRSYMNNNQNLIVSLMLRAGNTSLYGPGFQPENVIDEGLQKFIERTGPYDIVFTDAVVLFWESKDGEAPFKGCYTYFNYEKSKKMLR